MMAANLKHSTGHKGKPIPVAYSHRQDKEDRSTLIQGVVLLIVVYIVLCLINSFFQWGVSLCPGRK